MPELLLELFSEEIPARMQSRAADDLARAVNKALLDAGFMPEGVKSFAGPRRLVCVAAGLPARQPDRREEKKGPRVGAPEKAVEGFLKSAGLSSLDDCETRSDKKGEFYVAVIEQTGRDTAEVIAEAVPEIIRGFSWPKSMRWGTSSGDDESLRWVRPLHRILCVFNEEPIAFEIDGVTSGDETEGHRFMTPGVIQTRSFDDYASKLRAAHVVLDADERREIIAADAATLCKAQGLELVDDQALLNEVAGLAEWPVALMGSFDEKFLKLPDEVLTASMRGHQKYFSVKDPKTGRLANKFVCVANIEAPDGGAAMRTGYERVLTARLSDGWYLYNQDLKTRLEDRINDLDRVTFFEGLGSVGDKARRVAALAKEIAPAVGADPAAAERAALLAKADLVTGMVYEFPELQGVMGRYYALEEGEAVEIADAIRDHYKPAGQGDDAPTAPVSVAVALADKIDSLVGFWAIDKKPTGSSDPFALRRAALGVIAIILSADEEFELSTLLVLHYAAAVNVIGTRAADTLGSVQREYKRVKDIIAGESEDSKEFIEHISNHIRTGKTLSVDLLDFIRDRLRVFLRDNGHRHDHIEAVLIDAEGNPLNDVVIILRKLIALESFLATPEGSNLIIAYKRAGNIIRDELKKEKGQKDFGDVKEDLLLTPSSEASLYSNIQQQEPIFRLAIAENKFENAMSALAILRYPIDGFFSDITVNDKNPAIRKNRLALLQRFIRATERVADFSKLEG